MNSNVSRRLGVMFCYIIFIQAASFLMESGQAWFASRKGYEGTYNASIGRLSFHHPEMSAAFTNLSEAHQDNQEMYTSSPEWKTMLEKNQSDRAGIEDFGKIFSIVLSAVGLMLYFLQIRLRPDWYWPGQFSLMFGFSYMRDVVTHSFDMLRGYVLCQEASLWQSLGWSVFPSVTIFVVIGLGACLLTFFQLSVTTRKDLVIGGLAGVPLGGIIWWTCVGEWLL